MQLQKVKIEQLNPAAYNPRLDLKPGDEQYEQLKKSISTWGYVVYLVWNSRTGNLVAGHQRLKVLKELGYAEVDVVVVDLSLEAEAGLNLALNKIGGDWDQDKLAEVLNDVLKVPEFDLGATGFTLPEVNDILDAQIDTGIELLDPPQEISVPDEAVTKPGDLVCLGPHKIFCGDTGQKEALVVLLGAEKVYLVHMDLPFGVKYDHQQRPVSAERRKQMHKWPMIVNDDLQGEEYFTWVRGVMENLLPYLVPGCAVYLWSGFRNFGGLTQLLVEIGMNVSNVITWAKPSACLSFSDYRFASEFLLYSWVKGSGPHRWFGPKDESNVWNIAREGSWDLHPTAKPVELAMRVMLNSSQRGDIVFDGCAGSGFNLISAERTGRVFRGVEIVPGFVDVMVRRFAKTFGLSKVSEDVIVKYGLR